MENNISFHKFSHHVCCIATALLVLFAACNNMEKNGGDQNVFIPSDPVQDTDGEVYKTVRIGHQTWMAENLKKTKIECDSNWQVRFANGIERGPGVTFCDDTPRYAYYQNNQKLGWGVLYSHAVLQHCDICPPGYRVPSKEDWEILMKQLGGPSNAGKHLLTYEPGGFNALLGGRIDSYGSVLGGRMAFWWSADLDSIHPDKRQHAFLFVLSSSGVVKISNDPTYSGNSIRCVKK